MLGYKDAVPFSLKPDVAAYQQGIYQINGLISYHKKMIILEYKLNRANWGNTANINWVHELREENQPAPGDNTGDAEAGGIKKFEIDLRELREVQLKQNLLGSRLLLVANSLSVFENLHGATNEKLVLQISRKEKKNIRSMISKVQADLSEEKLNRLSEE